MLRKITEKFDKIENKIKNCAKNWELYYNWSWLIQGTVNLVILAFFYIKKFNNNNLKVAVSR